MTAPEPPDPLPPGRARRLGDMAALLPAAFVLLILPPYIRVFDTDATLAGLPLLHVYVFGLWAAAILASGLLAGRLARVDRADRGARSPDRDPDETADE